MAIRLAAATAVALLLATPAFADCNQELTKLEQATVSAETGASTSKSGMPVTKHQEELLPGNQQDSGTTGSISSGSTSEGVKAISPHQEQATGQATGHDADQVSSVMTEARQMAKAGDEQGCMNKLSELKNLMGVK
jgi:hypothetical protein